MVNEITNTQADVFIPERWRPGVLKGLYEESVIKNRVLNADGDVKGKGDILHIRIAPQVSVNDVGADGSVTNQALTATEAQLTVDQWKEATVDIVDKAMEQADEYLKTALIGGFAPAFAENIDSALFALHSGLTSHTAIDATAGLTQDLLLDAYLALSEAKVKLNKPESASWFFHWKEYKSLKKIAGISDASITKKDGGLLIAKIPDVLGLPVYFTTLVNEDLGEKKNILIHKEAVACGVQKNFNLEKFARTKKSTVYSADMLYGVKVVRANHGIVIRTTA